MILFLGFFCFISASTLGGSGATSASTLGGSGATSASTLGGSGSSSICSEKNAELSTDNGFVLATGFGLVSVNAGFSSWLVPSSWGIWPKLSDVTLLSSILM